MATLIGVVSQVIGEVYAVAGDGTRRPLSEGDRVFAGEQIVTGAAGSIAIAMSNGQQLTLGRDSSLNLTEQMLAGSSNQQAPTADTSPAVASDSGLTDVEQLQAAIEAGVDPTIAGEATAAGPGAGGGAGAGGGGHSFVLLGETGGALDPVIGFDTEGLSTGTEFPDPEPVVADEPVVEIPDSSPVIEVIYLDGPPTGGENQPDVVAGPGVVDEAALVGGSNPDSPAESTYGSLVINSPDGVSRIEIQGADGVWVNVLGGGTVVGVYGTLQFDAVGNWVYTLNANTLDHSDAGATGAVDQVGESFPVRVFDNDGDVSPTVSLDVVVYDDGPSAQITLNSQTTLILDESIGVDPNDSNAAADDNVAGNPFPGGYGTPIGLTSGNLINVVTADVGSDDEGAAVQLSLSVVDANSGLMTTDGQAITLYQEVNGSITGRVGGAGGTVIFAVSIDAAGKVTVAQYDSLKHPTSPDSYDESANLAGKVEAVLKVTDGDGDVATSKVGIGGQIVFEDDGPSAFTPLSTYLNNVAGAVVIGALDIDGNIDDNTGADQLGSVTFTAVDGSLSGFKSGGLDIRLYVSDDGKNLTGSTALTEDSINYSNTVYTVVINQDGSLTENNDTYTLTMVGTVDNGSGSTFSNLSGGVAGNPPFKIIESTTLDALEMLFTPINAGSVNSDNDDVAVDGQFIDIANPDKGLRIDFGDFTHHPNSGGTSDDGFTINQHTMVNGFRFTIDQVSQGTTADVLLKVFDANEGAANQTIGAHNFGDDPLATINKVKIYNNLGVLIGIATADTTIAGVIVDFDPSGTVLIQGLQAGYSVVTYTADGYDRLEVFNVGTPSTTDGKFSLSKLSVETTNVGSSVDMDFGVKLTDADGDSVAGNIYITVEPAALSGNDIVNGTVNSDTLYGGAGDDTLSGFGGNDVLFGGSGNDTLLGGDGDDILIGGLGADTMTGGDGKDTFLWQKGGLGGGLDHITDFNVDIAGVNSDILDLSQLLSGVGVNPNVLQDYLDFAFLGTTTTISVRTVVAGPVEQQVMLDNVNLSTLYGTSDEAAVIMNMLDDNALKTA